jgi:hypothetical protein
VTQVLKSVDCPDKPEIVPGLELVCATSSLPATPAVRETHG